MNKIFDRQYVIPAYIVTAMWYMVCVTFIPEPWCAIFKVIPIGILIAALAVRLKDAKDRQTLLLPIIALSFSMIGDVFGDMKVGSFKDVAMLWQMAAFLLAHVVYIGSFLRFMSAPRPNGLTKRDAFGRLGCVLFMVMFLMLLCDTVLPVLESPVFRIGVSAYMVVISVMVFTSMMQMRKHVWQIILGALLFALSDAIIAWTAFLPATGIPLAVEDTLVFLTYFSAQILINVGLLKKE
ncbi:MAG: lysoplasmalogenase [Bacteroidales bacterium]|nr:lysoplasmalogenase [Bacteroidales bacterium]